MANDNIPKTIKLPPEVKTQLEGLEVSIDEAERSIKTLQKLGMDVKVISDQIKWAREVRSTLLKDFG